MLSSSVFLRSTTCRDYATTEGVKLQVERDGQCNCDHEAGILTSSPQNQSLQFLDICTIWKAFQVSSGGEFLCENEIILGKSISR